MRQNLQQFNTSINIDVNKMRDIDIKSQFIKEASADIRKQLVEYIDRLLKVEEDFASRTRQ